MRSCKIKTDLTKLDFIKALDMKDAEIDKLKKEKEGLELNNSRFKKLIYLMFRGAWFGGISQQKTRAGNQEGSILGVIQAFRNSMSYYNTVSETMLINDEEYDEWLDLANAEEESRE